MTVLAELREIARTIDPEVIARGGMPRCDWCYACSRVASDRVRLYRQSGAGRVLLQERRVCELHALAASVLSAESMALGFHAVAEALTYEELLS